LRTRPPRYTAASRRAAGTRPPRKVSELTPRSSMKSRDRRRRSDQGPRAACASSVRR
jgi:hypothetical protein